jgi:ankyrin repeat protein
MKEGKGLPTKTLIVIMTLIGSLLVSCAGTPPVQKQMSLSDLVKKGDLDGIRKFYANQEQLNQKDADGLYPLHYAVAKGDPQIAEILIVLGAKPDVLDPAGKTPLRYAIDRNETAMAKMLVDRGANPFIADASGFTPSEAALNAGSDMISAVFNSKNINTSGSDGRTVLHMAADRLMEKDVALLLSLGASAQIKDKADRTPLDLALLYPDKIEAAKIAELLILKGATPSFPEFAWFATTIRSADYSTVRFSNGNTPLHEAVSRFQYGFVAFLLVKQLDPNIKNLQGEAPLHIAVKTGWLDGAKLLLQNNADPNIRDAKNNTPLHLAVPPAMRLKMTQLLLAFKADPALKDNDGNTPLHKAVKLAYEPAIVEALIGAGAPVNSANLEGDTPLMLCVSAGNYQYADALIKGGADIFLKNLKGESPLSLAVARGVDAVDKIVLPSNVLQRDNSGNSVLISAIVLKGSPEVVSLILSKGADPNVRNNSGDTALHVAVRQKLSAQALLLLNAKADIFIANSNQETPLFLALTAKGGPLDWFFIPVVLSARDTNGDTVVHHAARKNLPDGIDYLVKKGADMNAVNNARETPLHAAVKSDAADAARYLIANGSDLLARDINGDTPLNVSVLWNAKTCLQVLVLSGADLNARNFSGEAPLHQAVRKQNSDAAIYLLDRGADHEVRDNRGFTPLAVAGMTAQTDIAQALIKAGATVDSRDNSGSTPLYYAVDSGKLDIIRLFVHSDADILARNAIGDYPLALSLKKGSTVLRELLTDSTINRADSEGKTPLRHLIDARVSPEILAIATSSGADASSRDRYADTPLHAALKLKDTENAIFLIKSKADIYAPDKDGITPVSLMFALPSDTVRNLVTASGVDAADTMGETLLDHAVRAANADMVQLLLSMGAKKDLKNINNETALDIATTKNLTSIAAMLK